MRRQALGSPPLTQAQAQALTLALVIPVFSFPLPFPLGRVKACRPRIS